MPTFKYSEDFQNEKVLNFLRRMPQLIWKETLNKNEVEIQTHVAVAILQSISLLHYCKTLDTCTIHVKSKYLINALKFLCKDDILQTVKMLKIMFEDLSECKPALALKLSLAEIRLHVTSKHTLKTIVVTSISQVLASIDNNLSNQYIFLDISKLILLTLSLTPNCPFSEFYLHLLGRVVKKIKMNKADQKTILCSIYPYLNQTHFKEAQIYANSIANYLIQKMKTNRKIRLFDKINDYCTWYKADCAVVRHLINNWPQHIPLDFFMGRASPRLARMMFDTSFTVCIVEIIRISTKHMTFKTWYHEFIKNVISNSCFTEGRNTFSLGFSECVCLGIQRFGSLVYEEARNELLTYFTSLTLFYSVQDGCVNAMDFKDDIDKLLQSANETIQRFTFKSLCTFHNMDAELSVWHIENVKYYLENVSFVIEPFCIYELDSFVSHMAIKANNIIRYGKQEKTQLKWFVEFSMWLYKFSVASILSDALENVIIGDQIFLLAQYVFGQNSSYLSATYELDESQRYGTKESPFYKHLVQSNKFFYDKPQVFHKILKNFLMSNLAHAEVISFLKKWYVLNGPCNFSYMEALQNRAMRFLDLGYDEVSSRKGTMCIHLTLLHKSLHTRGVNIYVEYMFNKWFRLVEAVDTDGNIKDPSPVYGYTICVISLLKHNYINDIQFGDFFDNLITACEDLAKKFLKKWTTNTQTCIISKMKFVKIEQTILMTLEMIEYMLDNYYNEILIQVAIELGDYIIENEEGMTEFIKQAAEVRAKAVKQYNIIDETEKYICTCQKTNKLKIG